MWEERALGRVHRLLRLGYTSLRGGNILVVGNRLPNDVIELRRMEFGPPVAFDLFTQRNTLIRRRRRIALRRVG